MAKVKPRIDTEGRTRLETVIPLPVPLVIFCDPSSLCNFQCKFCPTGDRNLIRKVRPNQLMDFNLYKKVVNDILQFEKPIKVLRLYKDGEPLLNPKFADMIKYAKDKGCAERIDTTTNASLLSPRKNIEIIEAGLDRINISVEGISKEQYHSFARYRINFEKFVENIAHFYEHRKQCEVIIKINGDLISKEDVEAFFEIFQNIADGIYVEHVMQCWPLYELKEVKVNEQVGIYGQPIREVEVCPYVFYSISVNAEGTVSLCFLDWNRQLLIGDVRQKSLLDIWHGEELLKYQKMFLKKQRKNHPICSTCGQLSHGMPDNIDDYAEALLKKLGG